MIQANEPCSPFLSAIHTAGGDATEAFFGLHRFDVLEKPQYQRLQIGVIEGEEPTVEGGHRAGKLSKVPYGEPSWLSESYHSPYYKEVRQPSLRARQYTSDGQVIQSHRNLQKAVRDFVDNYVYPDAQERELDGKRPSQSVLDKMA